jgi:transcriptional regulator with XRE-family HTH domain
MIKNENQLNRANERQEEILALLNEYQQEYDGIERDFLVLPLIDEVEEIRNEIEEYIQLRTLPFESAVSETLSKPTLIDDIGELLAKLRLAAKLTQTELSERLGWEQPNLSRFESDNYSSQTIGKTVEFASELGVRLYVIPSLSELDDAPFKINYIRADIPKWRLTTTSTLSSGFYEGLVNVGISSAPKVGANIKELTPA